jgi:hypothetical protein
VNQQLAKLKSNIDMKIVISSAIGAAMLGAITYAAVKSGVKPLATVGKVAKGA